MSLEGPKLRQNGNSCRGRAEVFARCGAVLPFAAGFGSVALAAASVPRLTFAQRGKFSRDLDFVMHLNLGMALSLCDGGLNQWGAKHCTKLIAGISVH